MYATTDRSRPLIICFFQSLKECADEIDLGTQYHLTRYAFLYESIVLSDGSVLVPQEDGTPSPDCMPFLVDLFSRRCRFEINNGNH